MLLMIDNYDSFTYNLVQYLSELGVKVEVFRNDAIGIDEIESMDPEQIVISPGPCTPDEAGISVEVVRRFGGRIPLLGVCLGHQCIGQAYGARIVHADRIMHGKTSMICHHGGDVFTDVDCPFEATRYHSLVIEPSSLPPCLEMTAWSDDRIPGTEIMAVRHVTHAVFGLQFHPESILTRSGHQLLRNFLSGSTALGAERSRAALA